jgi:transposase
MAKPGVRKINDYGIDFKLRAVQLSEYPGVLVKDVAQSLDIHPFMLSKWRKQALGRGASGVPCKCPQAQNHCISQSEQIK